MRSLDWRVMMHQGERYELRQSIGIGFGNFSVGDYGIEASLGGYIDVSYPFVYPGWVTQDTNGGSDAAADLVWPLLGPAFIHHDETYVYWDNREEGLAFCKWGRPGCRRNYLAAVPLPQRHRFTAAHRRNQNHYLFVTVAVFKIPHSCMTHLFMTHRSRLSLVGPLSPAWYDGADVPAFTSIAPRLGYTVCTDGFTS